MTNLNIWNFGSYGTILSNNFFLSDENLFPLQRALNSIKYLHFLQNNVIGPVRNLEDTNIL